MIAAITAGDWEEAGRQMLDSKAAKQTGDRYTRLSQALVTNDDNYLELGQTWDPEMVDDAQPPSVKLSDVDSATLLYEIARRMGLTVKQEEQQQEDTNGRA